MSIWHLSRAVALLTLVALAAPSPSWAKDTWKKDLERALAERYPLSKQESKKLLGIRFTAGTDVQQIGTVLLIKAEGITAEPRITGHSTYWVTVIEESRVTSSGGGFRGALAGNSTRVGRRSLRLNERISPVAFDVDDAFVKMTFVTVDTDSFVYRGSQLNDHLYGVVAFKFAQAALLIATVDQVAAVVEAAFAPAASPSAGPATVSLGQTREDVRRSLGQPEKVIDLGTKVIWAYKDLKVVFVDGKVSDVQ